MPPSLTPMVRSFACYCMANLWPRKSMLWYFPPVMFPANMATVAPSWLSSVTAQELWQHNNTEYVRIRRTALEPFCKLCPDHSRPFLITWSCSLSFRDCCIL